MLGCFFLFVFFAENSHVLVCLSALDWPLTSSLSQWFIPTYIIKKTCFFVAQLRPHEYGNVKIKLSFQTGNALDGNHTVLAHLVKVSPRFWS